MHDKIGKFDTSQNQVFPHHGDVLPKSYIPVKIPPSEIQEIHCSKIFDMTVMTK